MKATKNKKQAQKKPQPRVRLERLTDAGIEEEVQRFLAAYNAGGTLSEIGARLGISKQAVAQRAEKYRRKGFPLKKLDPRGRKEVLTDMALTIERAVDDAKSYLLDRGFTSKDGVLRAPAKIPGKNQAERKEIIRCAILLCTAGVIRILE